MPLCWISRSPIRIVSHWLFLRKGVFPLCQRFFLCFTRSKTACLFHLARAGQCNTSESSSSFILKSSSWRSPRVGSKVEKVTREGVSSKHLKKRKGLNHQTQSDKVEGNQDQNERSDPKIIAIWLILTWLKTMFTNYPMLPTCNRKLVPKLHSAALFNAVQHSIEALNREEYILTHTFVHLSPGKGHRQQKGL